MIWGSVVKDLNWRRRRRTPQEKLPLFSGLRRNWYAHDVSHVARLYGINANQIFKWRSNIQRRWFADGCCIRRGSGANLPSSLPPIKANPRAPAPSGQKDDRDS
ncbi:hypothetical protein KCP69_16270 [Salmonella enterica subsp. enterica]|nr:hypothetical protein KCP69_16270 [Salmonella enterica subsp. enterica]